MPYTLDYMQRQFPDDNACLEYIFRKKYPDATGYHRVKGRKCYAHQDTGKQIYPLKGTIFEKSPTSLSKWFLAIYIFAESDTTVSIKDIQRKLGVTYKAAWRISRQINLLLEHMDTIPPLPQKESYVEKF